MPVARTVARHGRIVLALVAWPPIGYVAASLVGELTGCARFSASCGDPGSPANTLLSLAIQALVVALLIAVPLVARPAAVATVAVVVASVPAAVLLDSFGGARAQDEAQLLLGSILAIAYGAGLAIAIAWADRLPEPFGRRTMGA